MSRDKRNWIQTYTGRAFWPLDPRPEDVCIEDIAHALAMKCRYTGHCREFYSVAQHSTIVSRIVPPADALWGLLHDAAEAYLPDVARPVKKSLAGFDEIESRVMACVAEALGLSGPCPESVHRADLAMLATEKRDLLGPEPIEWTSTKGIEPLSEEIWADYPRRAEDQFLARWKSLTAAAAVAGQEVPR